MGSLCIAEAYPWPPQDGYKLRLANMIEALLQDGPVDFLCLDGSRRQRDPAPDGVTVIDAPEGPELPAYRWIPRWLFSRQPRRLVRRDFSKARAELSGLDPGRYGVTFFSHVDSWRPTHDLVAGPAFLDFDNLENYNLAGTRRLGPVTAPGDGVGRKVLAFGRWLVASAFNVVDEHRWDRAQRGAATTVGAVLVCSELDVERSGCPNAVVVPNGYQRQWENSDHRALVDPDRPVFLFVGLLGYDPNIDAVRWFSSEILPKIRRHVPDAQFRVVGRHAESVASLDGNGVTIVGEVETLRPEMDCADVAVVPIRSGAGTRLKVVEAMANRLPIVSTTIGCEGIDVEDGEHILVADDAESFARKCVDAISDFDSRVAIIDAAEKLYLEHYQWSRIREEIQRVARDIADEGKGGDEGPTAR